MKTNKKLRLIILVLGVALVSVLSYELFYWLTHVYEFDARIKTELTTLSSPVDANIEKIYVKEGDQVSRGSLLVALDSEVERLRIEALKVDLARERARVTKLLAEKDALEKNLKSRIATKTEEIRALRIERKSIDDRLKLSQKNIDRSKILHGKQLLSSKRLEEEQAKALDLAGQVNFAAAKVRVAERERDEIEASKSSIGVLVSEIGISGITIEKIKILIKESEEKRKQRFIVSPIDGIIDNIFKYEGEHAEENENLILLHDTKSFWIEANIEETQLRHLKVSQKVVIDIDAYPFDSFTGVVTRIGSVTTAQMDRGNGDARASKATQRIPVYIKLLDPPATIAPGMLVEVNIQIYDQLGF
ncbi:MAG: HlyD family efflux transporter periplasmic adaptor subunit [Alphaproteobacteria bacterium]|nr:HlyD family efflux transporter periplasmic adaptor subunit [Alphaproteobacteria bacterium]